VGESDKPAAMLEDKNWYHHGLIIFYATPLNNNIMLLKAFFYPPTVGGPFDPRFLQLTANQSTVGDVLSALGITNGTSGLFICDKVVLDNKSILSEHGLEDGDNVKVVRLDPRFDKPPEFAWRVYIELSAGIVVSVDVYPFLRPCDVIDSLVQQSLVDIDDGNALMLLHKGNVLTYESNDTLFDLNVEDSSVLYLCPVHFSNR
jgi:sulfur carrier protein ThiS